MSGVPDSSSVTRVNDRANWLLRKPSWERAYVRRVVIGDFAAAFVAALVAVTGRFGAHPGARYLVLSLVLPLLWVIAVLVSLATVTVTVLVIEPVAEGLIAATTV